MKKLFNIETIFVIVYFIEQIALVVISDIIPQNRIRLLIGIFPIIFLSTLALEKLFLKDYYELRQDKLLKENVKQSATIEEFKKDSFAKEIINSHRE